MGVASVYFSTQASSNAFGLKPFFSYHPPLWLTPSTCRLGDRSVRLRRHYGLTERREVKSLQNSDEHCLPSYGPSSRVPNPWNTHLPVLPPMDVRRSAYHSSASHQPNSGPSPSFINQNKTIYPTYDHQTSSVQSPSKLAWERESYRQKVKRDQVCKNIAAGGVSSDSHQYDDLLNGYAASAHGHASEKNPFEASFSVYRSSNSTDKDASRSLLARKPGNHTEDTSNGSFKLPKNMLAGKVTANGVEVLSECSTVKPELSVQTHGVNNGASKKNPFEASFSVYRSSNSTDKDASRSLLARKPGNYTEDTSNGSFMLPKNMLAGKVTANGVEVLSECSTVKPELSVQTHGVNNGASKKNPFEASFSVYRSSNSTDKDASRSLLARKPGNYTEDTSNGSFMLPKNMLAGKVTANGVEVLSECSTVKPEISVQTHDVNNGASKKNSSEASFSVYRSSNSTDIDSSRSLLAGKPGNHTEDTSNGSFKLPKNMLAGKVTANGVEVLSECSTVKPELSVQTHGVNNGASKKNPSEASFSVYRSSNSTDIDSSRSLLARKPGNHTEDTSNGSFKLPKNMLAGKVTANGVEVLSECSTVKPELSVQTHGVNNGVKTPCWNSSGKPELLISTSGVDSILKKSVRTETLNGKEHDLDVYGGRPNDDERFSECTSRIGILKKSSRKDSETPLQRHTKLLHIYDKVLVVDDISTAKNIVQMLTTKYKNLIHACDTEVAKIDVKQETPVDHGEVICFSIYSGPAADFGNGKSCIWVDLLDGDSDILTVFAPFFEDPSIKKVWHNYSFDCHVIRNHGIEVSGFHADTMHLARLWDSSRRINGGYSLEALTSDSVVMGKIKSEKSSGTVNASIVAQVNDDIDLTTGKISMKDIFGKKKLKKDGSEGKLINIAPVEVLQREERIPWICYSALDSISTLKLFESLKNKLEKMEWFVEGKKMGNMYNFYEKYWQPFGNILVEMEAEGMLVNRTHLSEIEKVAVAEQKAAADKFRNWAVQYCPDAKYMNVGSDTQIRQLFFGGMANIKDPDNFLPEQKTFKVPNVDNVIEEGKKSPTKFQNITLTKIGGRMQTDIYTASGWPSVSGDALKNFAGQVSTSDSYLQDDEFLANNTEDVDEEALLEEGETAEPVFNFDNTNDTSVYGTAYAAFGGGKKGRDACLAIAALCEICSIDSLISNFILPLQGDRISGKGGRIHCSLNINTETGRLSARRPNLQNPPALEKDRYKIREAFIAAPGNSLVVADYGQLELRILAHLANCKSMLDAFKAGGDFHSRTAMNMYDYIRNDVEDGKVLLEWHSKPGEDKPPVPLLKDAFASERRKAKMLNFSIAYGKTAIGLARDWKVPINEAKETRKRWYRGREEVLKWQERQKEKALKEHRVHTLLGRARNFPRMISDNSQRGHIQRAAINAPVQGSAADVAMCAMLQIERNNRLKELNWKLLLQVHDEVILEGPSESAEEAKAIVNECMSKPFDGHNFLRVELVVDAKCAHSWYAAK